MKIIVLLLLALTHTAQANPLEQAVGRSEVRIYAAPFPLQAGNRVADLALTERLERLGYERVHVKPDSAGTYFYGHEKFWIYQRAHRLNGREYAASLIGLELRPADGMILGALGNTGKRSSLDRQGVLWLEPETIAESLSADRADRIPVVLDLLPERVWRTVLAAEDDRFFSHAGVDARSIARATLANLKAGEIKQGGSTITQQLIKNRDLSPKRSMSRKISEAMRALMIEAEYDKIDILQAYLNQLYLGHVDGLAVHGLGTAAQVYFSKPAAVLTLSEAALLAAIIQGPNRLSPIRAPEAVRTRRDWVLGRMAELGWATPNEVRIARDSDVQLHLSIPVRSAPAYFVSWISELVESTTPNRLERGRGVVVETTLDPQLQRLAQQTLHRQLERIKSEHADLRDAGLSAVLVALDADTGAVLAYVGGDPASSGDRFDRARKAERQPGSTVKPFIMLEALTECGRQHRLNPATRVADEPLRIELATGDWTPRNADSRFKGVIDARTALAESRNVPMIRIARHCGLEETAAVFGRVALRLPDDPPPSFVLGAIETTPLRLAGAYTVLASPGKFFSPQPFRRVERPDGTLLLGGSPHGKRVIDPAVAYIVRDMMKSAVSGGTAQVAQIEGYDVAAKTGSSSDLRDAWFAGDAGGVVTVVWVGLDGGGRLGLSGSSAAGPIWHEFMAAAVRLRPKRELDRPRNVVERFINPRTGLLVREKSGDARLELFRRGALPRRDRFWRIDRAIPVVR
jgi:penicillin-binding protein 1B